MLRLQMVASYTESEHFFYVIVYNEILKYFKNNLQ